MGILVDKKSFRKEAVKVRNSIENRVAKSDEIAMRLCQTEYYNNASEILCYVSYRSEVITDTIINKALHEGKAVALPKVEGDKMEFYYIHSLEDTNISEMGIREPADNCDKVTNTGNAIVIVPGTSFDYKGNRNGYGGGFYDRYLSAHKVKAAIGIAFEEQVYDAIPHDEYDIKMDIIITDERIY